MPEWSIQNTPDGRLRLAEATLRGMGSEHLDWSELLALRLRYVRVYTLYFPSRFDQALDSVVDEALKTFGQQTGSGTSVNFWDPTDPEFSRGLSLFGLESPPALVLATGSKAGEGQQAVSDEPYTIAFTDPAVLGDRDRLAHAVNIAHEVLTRGDRAEITRYLRQREVNSVLATVGRIATGIRDGILVLKPKFGLPGGFSVQLG